jgi:hypothetical protein
VLGALLTKARETGGYGYSGYGYGYGYGKHSLEQTEILMISPKHEEEKPDAPATEEAAS